MVLGSIFDRRSCQEKRCPAITTEEHRGIRVQRLIDEQRPFYSQDGLAFQNDAPTSRFAPEFAAAFRDLASVQRGFAQAFGPIRS